MDISMNEDYSFSLKKVFVPLIIESEEKEKLSVCQRDTGFEMEYEGTTISCKEGVITLDKKVT